MCHIKYILLILSIVSCCLSGDACTSAIVSAKLNPAGRPMLWKHRDTDTTDNKIEYVAGKEGAYSYVALFNSSDKNMEEAWMGMNEMGFAIMNTASYNIKDDNIPASEMDKEGILMSVALKSCKTVDDFRQLLDRYPRPMGVEANFGVIDATGEGAYFETNNNSYTVYMLSESEEGILIRTNYSHSGRDNEGYGFIREKAARHLLQPYIQSASITPEVLTEDISRNFYHALLDRDMAVQGERWIIDQDFIPRYKSTATIVIEGCRPIQSDSAISSSIGDEYIMWTGLGYPPCADIFPVWCKKDGVDPSLRGLEEDGHSRQCDMVKARRAEVFPIHKGSGDKYIDICKLFNKEGTGYVQVLNRKNHEIYQKFQRCRNK